jgi:hypothetical protein
MTEIYTSLHPLEIDDLPVERVETDLMLYQIREQRRDELRK